MTIEFPCIKCQVLLRVPDQAAGKHAKCPSCGELMITPAQSLTPDGLTPVSGLTPISSPPPGQLPPGQLPPGQLPPGQLPPNQAPFGQLPPGQTPPPNPADNPYSATAPMGAGGLEPISNTAAPAYGQQKPAPNTVAAKAQLQTVGGVMLALGILSTMMHLGWFVNHIGVNPISILSFGWLMWSSVILLGGLQMLRAQALTLCWIAAGLCVIPCSCCAPISIPVGVWALMTLGNDDVSAVFQSQGGF